MTAHRLLIVACLVLAFAFPAIAQWEDAYGIPEVDRANFQAIELGGAETSLLELKRALIALSNTEKAEDQDPDAAKKRLAERQSHIQAALKAYRELLAQDPNHLGVYATEEDERWISLWNWVGNLFDIFAPRGSDIDIAWLDAFNEAAAVALSRVEENGNQHELLRITKRFPLSPHARTAARLYADHAFESGAFGHASKGYWAYLNLSVFQDLPQSELALMTAKGFLSARAIGWKSQAEGFLAVSELYAKQVIYEGENEVTLKDFIARAALEYPERDSLQNSLSDSTLAMPIPTLSGQATQSSPKAIGELAWPRIAVRGPMSPTPFSDLKRFLATEASPIVPTVTPSSILVNSGEKLSAYDFYTGQDLWGESVGPTPVADAFHHRFQDPNLLLTVLRWQDLAIAALENPLSKETHGPRAERAGFRTVYSAIPVVRRKLVAVDHTSGKIRWELGGRYKLTDSEAATMSELEREVALISFFTSTVVDDVLYATGSIRENESQLFLVAVDPSSGKPLWTRLLGAGQGESNMFGNPLRQAMPGIPVYAEGKLFVVSNLGAVMAVDLHSQAVSWVSRYKALPRPYTRAQAHMYRKLTFLNGAPVISRTKSGRLLLVVAPTDSRYISAFDLRSGDKVWETPVENRQQYASGRGDSGGTCTQLIGVTGEHVYLGYNSTLVRLSLTTGGLEDRQSIATRNGSELRSVELDGRAVIGGDTLYWPAVQGLCSIDISKAELPKPPFDLLAGTFGNLQISRGALVNFFGKSYIPRTRIAGFLEVRFDARTLLERAEKQAETNPDDPRAQLRLVQLAKQLGNHSGYDQEKVEKILRRVIELSTNKPELADIRASAARELFDHLIAYAVKAKKAGQSEEFLSLLNEASAYAVTESQRLTLFLFEEEYVLDAKDASGQADFYRRWVASDERFQMLLRGAKVPVTVYSRWQLARSENKARNFRAALRHHDKLLEWAIQQPKGGQLVEATRLATKIIYTTHPEAYSELDANAKTAYSAAQALDPEERREALLALAERYIHASVALSAVADAVALDSATGANTTDINRRMLAVLQRLPNTDEKAQVLATLLMQRLNDRDRIGALQVAGYLSAFAAETALEIGEDSISIGDLLKKHNLEVGSSKDQSGAQAMTPWLESSAKWEKNFQPLKARKIRGRQLALGLVKDVYGSDDWTFFATSQGEPELVAMTTATGQVEWRSVGVGAQYGIVRKGDTILAFDLEQVAGLDAKTGVVKWRVNTSGRFIQQEVVAGVALVASAYTRFSRARLALSVIDIESGEEIWSKGFGPLERTVFIRQERSILVCEGVSEGSSIKRIGLISGVEESTHEIEFAVDRSSNLQVGAAGELVMRVTNPKTRRSEVVILNGATYALIHKIGPLSTAIEVDIAGDHLFLTARDQGKVMCYSIATGRKLWEKRNRPGNTYLEAAHVIGKRLVLLWKPDQRTHEVWATAYRTDTGGRTFHDALWKPGAGSTVSSAISGYRVVKDGIVLCVQPFAREVVEMRGREVQRIVTREKEYSVFDAMRSRSMRLEAPGGEIRPFYGASLEDFIAPNGEGLVLSDGVSQVSYYPLKAIKSD